MKDNTNCFLCNYWIEGCPDEDYELCLFFALGNERHQQRANAPARVNYTERLE